MRCVPKKRWPRFVVLIVMTALIVLGHCLTAAHYYEVNFDPYRVDRNWPELRASRTASNGTAMQFGRNIQVSVTKSESRYREVVLAANPYDPNQILTAAMRRYDGGIDLDAFVSDDAGQSWSIALELRDKTGKGLHDPTICYGPTGEVYIAHMRIRQAGNVFGSKEGGQLDFLRSADGGLTWEKPHVVPMAIDRPWIVVDRTSGPYRGRLFCLANINNPIFFTASDGGSRFSPFQYPSPEIRNCRPANPVILPDGEMLVAYADNLPEWNGRIRPSARPQIIIMKSNDGGEPLVDCGRVNTAWSHTSIKSTRSTGTWFSQLANNPDAAKFKNHVYCVWSDGAGLDEARIFVGVSNDNGSNWHPSTVLSEQPMTVGTAESYMTFIPAIAINHDGVVAVAWYDRRGLPPSTRIPMAGQEDLTRTMTRGWNVRMRCSLDSGESWQPSVQLNEQPGTGELEVGHTMGIAAGADGRFHVAWIDNRTGRNQIWASVVEMSKVLN